MKQQGIYSIFGTNAGFIPIDKTVSVYLIAEKGFIVPHPKSDSLTLWQYYPLMGDIVGLKLRQGKINSDQNRLDA
jgi:hypothetical protein